MGEDGAAPAAVKVKVSRNWNEESFFFAFFFCRCEVK